MRWWQVCLVGMLVVSAGCTGFSGSEENHSRLDLTVQNDRAQPVSFQLTVTDGDGAVIANESERLDGSVGRAYDFTVGTSGRHEVSVAGDDWRGQLAWNADSCAHFDATIRITNDSVEVAGECLQQQ